MNPKSRIFSVMKWLLHRFEGFWFGCFLFLVCLVLGLGEGVFLNHRMCWLEGT